MTFDLHHLVSVEFLHVWTNYTLQEGLGGGVDPLHYAIRYGHLYILTGIRSRGARGATTPQFLVERGLQLLH